MELVNALYAFEAAARDAMPAGERAALLREAVETVLLLLGPFSPHVTEELWEHLGHPESLFKQPWPTPDPAALTRQEVTVVLQVDGKVRGRLTLEVGRGRGPRAGAGARRRQGPAVAAGPNGRAGGGGAEPARQRRDALVRRRALLVLLLAVLPARLRLHRARHAAVAHPNRRGADLPQPHAGAGHRGLHHARGGGGVLHQRAAQGRQPRAGRRHPRRRDHRLQRHLHRVRPERQRPPVPPAW